ncbi:MAG: T9SS type A sorting domain-containing protein [Bacteroidota bacterium]
MKKIYKAFLAILIMVSFQEASATVHVDSTVRVITMFSTAYLPDFNNDFYSDLEVTFRIDNGLQPTVNAYFNGSYSYFWVDDPINDWIVKGFDKGETYMPSPGNWGYFHSNLKQQFSTPNKYLVMQIGWPGNTLSYYGWMQIQTDTMNNTITINRWAYSDVYNYPLPAGEYSDLTGVNDMEQKISFFLSRNFIQINDNAEIEQADIYNISGQLMESVSISHNNQVQLSVTLNERSPYLVRLRKEDGTFISKVVSVF